MVKKRLIVCCDGTANDGVNTSAPLTNVSRIARCIASSHSASRDSSSQDPSSEIVQAVYYRSGVGTGTSDWGNLIDWIWGRGIHHNIREAYNFICLNYSSQEDEIVLVGFSRGAFAVRAVASLISDVGVLKKSGLVSLNTIYDVWRFQHRDDQFTAAMKNVADSIGFEKAASSLKDLRENLIRTGKLFDDVSIKACAVWDTVAALPSSELSFVNDTIAPKIELAIHALALNEERGHFTPLLWKEPTVDTQTLKQCWFLGTHSGVGGGSKDLELGNISLAWMIAQLVAVVVFDTAAIYDITMETINTVPKVRQGDGPYQYGFALQLPIREFQARTDVHVGWFEYLFRFASWKSRNPFASGPESPETIHWSVPALVKAHIVRQSAPYQRLNQDLQEKVEPREAFEENLLRAWIVRECQRLIGLLISINIKRLPSDAIPLYPVLWEPGQSASRRLGNTHGFHPRRTTSTRCHYKWMERLNLSILTR